MGTGRDAGAAVVALRAARSLFALGDTEDFYASIRGLTFQPGGGSRFAGGGSYRFSRRDVMEMEIQEFESHIEALNQLRADEHVALEQGSVQGSE